MERGLNTPFNLSQRARRTTEQPIGYLMAAAVENPNLISLAAGLVDYPTLPSEQAARLLGELLTADPVASKVPLQYGTTQGYAPLRRRLLEHVASLDGLSADQFPATPDDLVITTGSQQLLFILTDILVDPGDIVITAWPSYFVYTNALNSFGAEVRCVDIDEQGMRPDRLDDLLRRIADDGRLHRVKIVYLVDYHQNPTGITLSADRRPAILDIVQKYSTDHRILLIEDAAYRELTYEGVAPPSIKRHDTHNAFVALAQTFSKPFAPGLKTGYGVLPRDLVEPVTLQKGSHDFGSANICQHLLLRAMAAGVYADHVRTLCRNYAAKRDAMLDALERHFGRDRLGPARWTRPTGGLYVWLTLPDTIDTGPDSPLFHHAVREGVLYVPGSYCYPQDPTRIPPRNQMRLSFGTSSIEQIHQGIARLAAAVEKITAF